MRKIEIVWARAAGVAALAGASFLARDAAADVTLLEKGGWTVYTNGRVQAFFNYNNGDGAPVGIVDGNGAGVQLQGGGIHRADAWHELPPCTTDAAGVETCPDASVERGRIEELRIRTGFAGNLFGFGVKRRLVNPELNIDGYIGLSPVIQSDSRRSYTKNFPDVGNVYARMSGEWGSFTFGRQGTLFNRAATEITYLYAYAFALGFPGSPSDPGLPYPTAGHVGFGVMGNPTNAGFLYASPSLSGLTATLALFDANNIPVTNWERTKWPRGEGELAYETKFNGGMFKLSVNGAYQKIYEDLGAEDTTVAGVGYGGRVEVGPVHLGIAGHYAQGSGMDFAFQPSEAIANPGGDIHELRTFDGYYAQLQVSATKQVDISAGAGISRAMRTPEDLEDQDDDDMNPATPSAEDDATPGVDSVDHVPIKTQTGISAGVTVHATDNLHFAIDYFYAMFDWYTPIPAAPDQVGPSQKFHFLNAGATYNW